MNILDKIQAILNLPDVKKGYMPSNPDAIIALFEYSSTPPEHNFGGTDFVFNVQVRIRDKNASLAFSTAESVSNTLNHYNDAEISITQSSPILDIGYDNVNPPRQEYTINFIIRRK